jgi:hypothetical protein
MPPVQLDPTNPTYAPLIHLCANSPTSATNNPTWHHQSFFVPPPFPLGKILHSADFRSNSSISLDLSFSLSTVAILIPAEMRAYSWYHHMRAHADPTAINMSFKQVIFICQISQRVFQTDEILVAEGNLLVKTTIRLGI